MESAKLKKSQKAANGPAEAEETEALLQSKHSQTGPLLRMFWSMFGTYFLLSTVCLVICDVFLFSTPKVLRYEHIYNIFLSHVHELRGVVCQHRHTNNDLLKFSHADKRSSGVICAKPSQVRRKRHKATLWSCDNFTRTGVIWCFYTSHHFTTCCSLKASCSLANEEHSCASYTS